MKPTQNEFFEMYKGIVFNIIAKNNTEWKEDLQQDLLIKLWVMYNDIDFNKGVDGTYIKKHLLNELKKKGKSYEY